MTDTTYNGWRNYETWLVALWIDNEESAQNAAREIGENIAQLDPAEECSMLGADYWTPKNRSAWYDRRTGEEIRAYIDDEDNGILPSLGAGLASDLIRSALDSVDWTAIGAHYAPEPSTVPDEDEDGDA